MSAIAEPFRYEIEYLSGRDSLSTLLIGIDEAGRGPLAGPVVVAGVHLPLPPAEFSLPVNDSKKLTERQREALALEIKSDSRIQYAIAIRSAAQIDKMNILRATQDAMREVAESLQAQIALVDGLSFSPFPCEVHFLTKGDSRSASIAAASILAKTTRDHIMEDLAIQYPGYGFEAHKGYGTSAHLEALNRLGPCPEHRRSFAPVSQPTLF